MLLAVDIGNSHMVIGVFAGATLRRHWRIRTDRNGTVDELASIFHSLFAMEGIRFGDISGLIIASVVPATRTTWVGFAKSCLRCRPLIVGENVRVDMEVRIDNPREIGADRLVNAVAAYHQCKTALIVVDFGTAITWDVVSADGAYLGGAIAPGIAVALEALADRTAKLPQIDIAQAPQAAIGTGTVAAIRSGILFGYGGMVDGLIERIEQELGTRPRTLATGGMAGLIAPYAARIDQVDVLLTLKGLQLLYAQNR